MNLLFGIGRLFGLLFLLASTAFAATQHDEILSRTQWSDQVNGTYIVTLPEVSRILRLFKEYDNIIVEIHHPNNDSGQSWAESLGHWLVTFGIPIRYIRLLPDSDVDNQIIITLIDQTDWRNLF